MAAPDPMRSISVDRWSVLGDIPRTSLTSAAFVIIGEVCSDDGELVPHVLLHTKERRTLMKGVSSYFGLDDDSFSSLTEMSGVGGVKFLQGAFGNDTKCPFIALVDSGGKLWTVGRNDWAQLGHHSRQNQTDFYKVKGVHNVVDVAVGMGHCLAVTKMNQVYAWGDNSFGQVGIGKTGGVVETATKVLEIRDENRNIPTGQIKQVAASWNRSLVLTRSGNLYVWGNNQSYQPKPFSILEGKADRFIQISCGKDHYLALSADGRVCVWGRNDNSQLGLGHKLVMDTPKVVDIAGRVVSVLAVGWTSLATTEHGVNYCWGRHDAVDFRYPKKTRNFPRPRDILAFGEEVDSGGSVTLDCSATDELGGGDGAATGFDTVVTLREELDTLTAALTELKDEHQRKIDELVGTVKQAREGAKGRRADVVKLMQDHTDARKDIQRLTSVNSTQKEDIRTLKSELQHVKIEQATKKVEQDRQREEMKLMSGQIKKLREDVNLILQGWNGLQKDLKSLQKDTREVCAMVKRQNTEEGPDLVHKEELKDLRLNDRQKDQVRSLISDLSGHGEGSGKNAKKKQGSTAVPQVVNDELRKLEKLRQESDKKIQDLTKAQEGIASDVQECKENYDSLDKNFEDTENDIFDLKAKLKSIQVDYENISVQHKELQSKYEEEAAETKRMKATLEDLSTEKAGGKACTDVRFSRKLKLLEETLHEILTVCDVIGTEQSSIKAKMTSLQVQLDSLAIPKQPTFGQSSVSGDIAGLRSKLRAQLADPVPERDDSYSPKRSNIPVKSDYMEFESLRDALLDEDEPVKNETPVTQEISDYVANAIGTKWRDLGRELGLKEALLEQISTGLVKTPDRRGAFVMLSWRRAGGATTEQLVQKLKGIGCHDIAEFVQNFT